MKSSLVLSLLLLATANINARDIKGKVKDAQTGEEIIGASILIKEEPGKGAVSGMDGSFNLSVARPKYTLVCSYVGYKKCEVEIGNKDTEIVIPLKSDDVVLEGVTVIANNPGRTEAGARGIERAAMNVVNVMSAKAIELSPDITVANVIQRMSGVTIERNSSGEGQYAILRGMDKRYNYTLINGVKIPSPDNKKPFCPVRHLPVRNAGPSGSYQITDRQHGRRRYRRCSQPDYEGCSFRKTIYSKLVYRLQRHVFRPRFSIVQSRSNRKTITLRTNGQARRQPGNNG